MEVLYNLRFKKEKFYALIVVLALNFSIAVTVNAQNSGITDATTFTPQSLLHIHQNAATGTLFQLTNTTSDKTAQTNGFIINMNTNFNTEFKNQYNNSAAGISFFTNNGSTSEKVTIKNDGNVGIGSTSPGARLDIADATINYGLKVVKTGTNYPNVAGYFSATGAAGADQNRALVVPSGGGRVGIGTENLNQALMVIQDVTSDNYEALLISSSNATAGTIYGLKVLKTGAATNNIGGYFTASGATNNYGLLVEDGLVGIGTTAPTALLHTIASGAKTADYSGNLLTNTATSSTAAVTKAGLEVSSTGTWDGPGSNNIGVYVKSVTGSAMTNYGGYFNITGNPTAGNVAGYFSASGAVSNFSVIVPDGGGNMGVGDESPAALFTVGSGDLFQISSTGYVKGINGSAATPVYSFTGDPNTGIYAGGTDQLGFVTNGTDRMYINASGNVGIGTTNPNQSLLQMFDNASHTNTILITNTIAGTTNYGIKITKSGACSATSYGFHTTISGASATNVGGYFTASGATNNYALVTNAGNVGLGTTTPTSILNIYDNSANTTPIGIIQQNSTGDATQQFLLTGGQAFTMGIDNSETNDPFVISDNTSLGTNNRMVIHPTGAVSFPSQSFVRVSMSGDQSIANTTYTTISFDTEQYDNLGEFASNTFTPTAPGYYLCMIMVQWTTSLTAGNTVNILIRKNASGTAYVNWIVPVTAALQSTSCFDIVYLNGSGDYIDFQAYQNSGVAKSIRGGGSPRTYATIVKVF